MLSRLKSTRGFTLIELAVVLIVIGIIALIGIPTFQTFMDKSRQKAVDSTADALARNLNALAATNDDGVATAADVTAAIGESGGAPVVVQTTPVAPDTAANADITVSKDGKSATVELDSGRWGRA